MCLFYILKPLVWAEKKMKNSHCIVSFSSNQKNHITDEETEV